MTNAILPTDSARRAEHVWQYATVQQVDCSKRPPVVKVKFDDEQFSDWIPFFSLNAAKSYIWMPPTKGAQGIVLSASGEMETLLFISGVFTDEFLPADASENLTEIRFPNGDRIRHFADTGNLIIKNTGDCDISCGGNFSVTARRINLNE